MEINPYVAISLAGFCNGLGVVIAQKFYEKVLAHNAQKLNGHIKKLVRRKRR